MNQHIVFEIKSNLGLFHHDTSDALLPMLSFPDNLQPIVLCEKTVLMKDNQLVPFAQVEELTTLDTPKLIVPITELKEVREELFMLISNKVIADESMEEIALEDFCTKGAAYAKLEPGKSVSFEEYQNRDIVYQIKNITTDSTIDVLIYAERIVIHEFTANEKQVLRVDSDINGKLVLYRFTRNRLFNTHP